MKRTLLLLAAGFVALGLNAQQPNKKAQKKAAKGKAPVQKTTKVVKTTTTTTTTKAGPVQGTTASGARYQIQQAAGGKKAMVGDVMYAHIKIMNSKDSVLMNTKDPMGPNKGKPTQIELVEHRAPGDLMDILPLISQGSKAKVQILTDSLFKGFEQQRPPFLPVGTDMKYEIEVTEVLSKSEYTSRTLADQKKALSMEEEKMKQYIAANKLSAIRTASGLYVATTQPGMGESPKKGQTVSVHYTGTLLDGTKFDSSVDRGQPFEFTLGQGQVIKGWDEGIALLKKGGKAKLVIPSSLGYGAQAAGSIPPNSVLVFDVELIDFK